MTGKAFVLLSGGIDSTTCLALAINDSGSEVVGVSVFYGQRHRKEIEYAKYTCGLYAIEHRTLDLSSIVPRTMLTDSSAPIPNMSYDEIKGVSPTYVPFRNGLLLSAIASHVAGEHDVFFKKHPTNNPDDMPEWAIYFGAHAEDAQNWAYPDCTPEFIGAMANAIYIGSYRTIRLHTPLQWLNKAEIIQVGENLGVPWHHTWSCYAGGLRHCGTCPTCRARKAGFIGAGVTDPTEYANAIVQPA